MGGTDWDDEFDAHPVRTTFLAATIALTIVFVIVAGVWGVVTGFSYWWGRGNAYQDKNSAQNWESAQRSFHQEQNDVIGFAAKIQQTRNEIADFDKAHPDLSTEGGIAAMNNSQVRVSMTTALAGLQQQCVNTVTQYNTDAQSYLTMDWRDADLPPSLTPSVCN